MKVETNEGLIDVSGCSIKIKERVPTIYDLIAEDFRTDKEGVITWFNHKENAEAAYEKIKEALKKNESYVDIKDCESENAEAAHEKIKEAFESDSESDPELTPEPIAEVFSYKPE